MRRNWSQHYPRRGGSYRPPVPIGESDLPSPGSDLRFEEVFDFPCITSEEAVDYLTHHGRVMFIIRGPPGTGKHTLTSMVISKYPDSKKCCADDYFSKPFAPKSKNRDTLKESHEYCHEKARKACEESKHPIIIQNSNIRKWEMQFYIDLAVEYCYTVVMVITVRKLSFTPEVLEKTNTQGLKRGYFQNRLKQWEEVLPEYTGWIPSPADIACITTEADLCLESLVEVKDFSDKFCSRPQENPQEFFTPVYFPFCLAAYCNLGASPLARQYYLSEKVQHVYGKVFWLTIQAFIVTKSLFVAVVHLKEDMKNLVLEDKGFSPVDASDLSHALGAFSLHSGNKPKQPVTDFLPNSLKTAEFHAREDNEKIDTKNCSFIILSTAVNNSPSYPYMKNVKEFSEAQFSDVTDSDGNISITSFDSLGNGLKYCRLPYDSWLILPSEEISVKSVFTGLYV